MEWIKYFFTFLFILTIFICDYRTFKIKNWIVLPFLIFGFSINMIEKGFGGFLFSFAGMSLPLLLIVFYALSMIGAGDVKAFCALGALFGWEKVIVIIAYSFIAGGIISVVMIIVNKNGLERIRYLFNYIKFSFLNQSFSKYSDFNNKDDKSVFRFSSAILVGTVLFLCFGSFDII